ncbi:hypothetical protein ACJZ2D_011548 [Fusarium nematophilum]
MAGYVFHSAHESPIKPSSRHESGKRVNSIVALYHPPASNRASPAVIATIITIPHLKYCSYERQGVRKRIKFSYNQAVRVGNKIECSGQGAWDPETGEFEEETNAQIDVAFANVERYHAPINNEALASMMRNFRKGMSDHEPLWACVAVTRLGEDEMRVEMEVVAHDPEGPKRT